MTFKAHGIPIRDWIEMTIKASASLLEFAKTTVCPVLRNKKNRSHFETAVTTTYNRMVLWLEDSLIAKEPIRIQIASTCARSMFEHLIDLKWLTLTPQSAERRVARRGGPIVTYRDGGANPGKSKSPALLGRERGADATSLLRLHGVNGLVRGKDS